MKNVLDCHLETKASAELEKAVAEELNVEDQPIEELLKANESSDTNRDSRKGDSSTK